MNRYQYDNIDPRPTGPQRTAALTEKHGLKTLAKMDRAFWLARNRWGVAKRWTWESRWP